MDRKGVWAWGGAVCLLGCTGLFAQQPDTGAKPANAENVAAQSRNLGPVPRLVKFSGAVKLEASESTKGPVNITFSLYQEQQGGEPLWQETQKVELDAQGSYTVLLGSTGEEGLPLEPFTTGQAVWLGIQVTDQAEQLPRVLLVSVPYALKAGDAATLGGKTVSEFVLAKPEEAPGKNAGEKGVASAATAQDQKGTKDKNKGAAPSSTNVIAKFLADGTLGDSAMYEAGGLVGIGTTSPLSRVHVVNPNVLPPRVETSGSGGGAGAGWDFYPGGISKGYVGVPDAGFPIAPGEMLVFGGANTKTTIWAGLQRAITVDTNGNVGIGTATPTSKLEIIGQDGLAITGFEPFLTLRDAGHENKRAYVQNVDGNVALTTDSQAALVVRDITGNVGIGTDTPTSKLEVVGDVVARSSSSTTAWFHNNYIFGGIAGRFTGGTVVVDELGHFATAPLCWDVFSHELGYCSSSIRYKEQVASLSSGLELVHKLRPVTFRWKETGTPDLGLVAEEVNSVEPLLVTHNAQGEIEGVKYDRLSAVLINAVNEQQAQIQQQQKLIQSLQRIVCGDHPRAKVCH